MPKTRTILGAILSETIISYYGLRYVKHGNSKAIKPQTKTTSQNKQIQASAREQKIECNQSSTRPRPRRDRYADIQKTYSETRER